ncbi:Dihydrolipoyllysine-residue acetyltransferase component of pyruvate dehydrogenase complex [Roseivivax jejudonensis]|uniref:Dihydrolipoyllysine-residue acetyltransferase component of pyruvate dehydrogenase complex n=1 Tax=Roseivivax jejudonensis TaxID=1529041 RepID=A0A1X6YXX7_9RHOB|nr:biotin/lipoyl-containing protein [Roseivivax jejudonensis]SLN34153.1 Dihydrolipoyllysine-residue acetyltransferase component of pyruvate dehydrogenase complex [Roseivivax jejudonensis]
MPHEVIMPALGMAQDTGHIVAWRKAPGDKVAEGDILFEVETDKATMEVEAQGAGFLTSVTAEAGADVPVGEVIARIADSPDDTAPPPTANGAAGTAPDTAQDTGQNTGPGAAEPPAVGADALPEGAAVIMPTLGMSQDSGLLVAWHKAPGDAVGADDVLFEVETDKSVAEVAAGHDGYVAALLAEAGEDVPTGRTIAIISAEAPERTVTRRAADAPEAAAAPKDDAPAVATAAPQPPDRPIAKTEPVDETGASGARPLASPKLRRLALQEGLDLSLLARAGHPQPFHARDLDRLRALSRADAAPAAAPAAASARRLTAEAEAQGFAAFARWASEVAGVGDEAALLAGLAAAGHDDLRCVAVTRFGRTRRYAVPQTRALSGVTEAADDAVPDLTIRDLRGARLAAVEMGPEATPVLTLAGHGATLAVTLECAAGAFEADTALALLTDFAGRLDDPLRHLL